MKASYLMTRNPAILEENSTALDAVNEMYTMGCGILPIGKIDRIVGVVTDRDIVIRSVANNKKPEKTLIKKIMTKNVIFCEKDDDLIDVIHKMNTHKIRRIFVKNKNQQLVGILSLTDVIQNIKDKHLLADLLKENVTV